MSNSIKEKFLKFKSRDVAKLYGKLFLLAILILLWSLEIYNYFQFAITKLIFTIVILYLSVNTLFNVISYVIIFGYRKKNNLVAGQVDNFILGIRNLTFFLSSLVFILLFLSVMGISIQNLFTSLSIVAVAIVLIFREFISNFLNGVTLMFSKNFDIRDYIKIGDTKGRITNLTFQNIEVKTDSGDYVYIPNSLIQSKELTNFSRESLKRVKVDIVFSNILYSTFIKFEDEIKKKIIEKFPDYINEVSDISIKVDKIEKDYANLSIEIKVKRYSFKAEGEIKDFVNHESIKFMSKHTKKSKK